MEINHQFLNEGFFIPSWDIKHLFLGTFNPDGGRKVAYFYGRPRNYTWSVLSKIFNVKFSVEDSSFLKLLEQNGIACMNMIASVNVPIESINEVTGKGYKDVKIITKKVSRIYNTDNINRVIENNPGINIYSTWGKGPTLKDWKAELSKIENINPLVSPSNAAKVEEGVVKFDYIFKDWQKKIIV